MQSRVGVLGGQETGPAVNDGYRPGSIKRQSRGLELGLFRMDVRELPMSRD